MANAVLLPAACPQEPGNRRHVKISISQSSLAASSDTEGVSIKHERKRVMDLALSAVVSHTPHAPKDMTSDQAQACWELSPVLHSGHVHSDAAFL